MVTAEPRVLGRPLCLFSLTMFAILNLELVLELGRPLLEKGHLSLNAGQLGRRAHLACHVRAARRSGAVGVVGLPVLVGDPPLDELEGGLRLELVVEWSDRGFVV